MESTYRVCYPIDVSMYDIISYLGYDEENENDVALAIKEFDKKEKYEQEEIILDISNDLFESSSIKPYVL